MSKVHISYKVHEIAVSTTIVGRRSIITSCIEATKKWDVTFDRNPVGERIYYITPRTHGIYPYWTYIEFDEMPLSVQRLVAVQDIVVSNSTPVNFLEITDLHIQDRKMLTEVYMHRNMFSSNNPYSTRARFDNVARSYMSVKPIRRK